MATKPIKKSACSGSPRRRFPDLYYSQVWLDKQTSQTVSMYADWNSLSQKAAVYQLLTFGLNYYATQQMRLEKARRDRVKLTEKIKLLRPDEIYKYLEHLNKHRKETDGLDDD